jgi:hypothetical protein
MKLPGAVVVESLLVTNAYHMRHHSKECCAMDRLQLPDFLGASNATGVPQVELQLGWQTERADKPGTISRYAPVLPAMHSHSLQMSLKHACAILRIYSCCLCLCCCAAPEINACLQYPCRANSTGPRSWSVNCTDIPNPAPNSPAGRICTCDLAGLVYASDDVGCTGRCNKLWMLVQQALQQQVPTLA